MTERKDDDTPNDPTEGMTKGQRRAHFRGGKQYTDEDRARWHAQYLALLEDSVPEASAKATAARLFNEGRGVQVSRRYRTVACLPVGETALEALKRAAPEHYRNVMRRAEADAKRDYATYCARQEGHVHELDMRTFAEFKKLEQHGQEWKPVAADLRQTEDLYGLSDPERERRIRAALADLDAQRRGAQ